MPPDLSADGFRLMGGRVLPDGDRQAALLYNDDHGTRLTIYLRLGTVEGTDLRYAECGGLQTVFSSECRDGSPFARAAVCGRTETSSGN